MSKPLLLDLFCGAGGAAVGYSRAGFKVVGVDRIGQLSYPFRFYQRDALDFLEMALEHPPQPFAAIHASPPCQGYSVLRHARKNEGYIYGDLIDPTRELLERSGLPWVIENVQGAPLNHSIFLCGSMFGLGATGDDGRWRQLRRHRLFETSFPILQPQCQHAGESISVYGGGSSPRHVFVNGATRDRYGRRGGYQGTLREKKEAMGIDWMNSHRHVNDAIPPAYTEFIGGWIPLPKETK